MTSLGLTCKGPAPAHGAICSQHWSSWAIQASGELLLVRHFLLPSSSSSNSTWGCSRAAKTCQAFSCSQGHTAGPGPACPSLMQPHAVPV